MIYSALVKLWGTTIGAVSLDDTQKTANFEYDHAFVSSGIEVSIARLKSLKTERVCMNMGKIAISREAATIMFTWIQAMSKN